MAAPLPVTAERCDVAGCPSPDEHFPVVQLVPPMEFRLADRQPCVTPDEGSAARGSRDGLGVGRSSRSARPLGPFSPGSNGRITTAPDEPALRYRFRPCFRRSAALSRRRQHAVAPALPG